MRFKTKISRFMETKFVVVVCIVFYPVMFVVINVFAVLCGEGVVSLKRYGGALRKTWHLDD